jgi:hypothetical protein
MSIVITDLGKNIIATKRTLKAVTDNIDAVRCRMEVVSASDGTVYEAVNEPDLGTSDEFTFEINHFLFRQFYNTQFPLSTDGIDERFDLKAFRISFSDIEADGTESAQTYASTTEGDFSADITFTHNITQRFNKVNAFDITDYYCDGSGNTSKLFLTSAPTSYDIWLNDKNYLSVLKWSLTGSTALQEFVVEEYNSSDTLLTTTKTTFINRNEGGINIPFHNTMEIEITDTDTAYAVCYVEDVAGTTKRSELRRYNVVNNCGNFKLEWINEFGKVDYFYFKGEQVKTLSTSSSNYQKATPINPTANDYGTRIYDNEISEEWLFYTDTISQDTVYFLSNMFLSKKVSLSLDGVRFPAILNSNKLTYYKDINGIYQISIPIVFANNVVGNN